MQTFFNPTTPFFDDEGHPLVGARVSVLPQLVKSPYKTFFLKLPYFMRVRKRFDAEKIRRIGWIPGIWTIFFGALVLPK